MASLRILIPIFWVSLLLVQCTTAPEQEYRPGQPDPVVERESNPDLLLNTGDNSGPAEVYSPPEDDAMKIFALNAMQGGVRPVLDRRGRPVAAVWSQDERKFCLVLSVSGSENPAYSDLTELSHLYNNVSPEEYLLTCFQWYRGDLFFAYTVKLGTFPVIENFKAEPFGQNAESAPMAVLVDFLSGEGGVSYFVFCSALKGSSLKIRRNSASFAQRKDLDTDGIDDVLLYEAAFEEGTGKETFISWYRWDGRSLSSYKTVNIVRNLNSFLKESAASLENRSFRSFLSEFVHVDSGRDMGTNLSFDEAFSRIFKPEGEVVNERDKITEESFSSTRKVIFPEILENPFDISAGDFSLELPVHFVADRDHRYSVGLVMNDNPFSGRQYYFVPRQP